MTVGSNVNPNFPIPGIDNSSRGFRDNFATIKQELENLQSKNIQLAGSLISNPIQIGNGTSDIVIPVDVSLANIQAAGSNLQVQYNFNGVISGSSIYYNAGSVGIGSSQPQQTLDVVGNARVVSPSENTFFRLGSVFYINSASNTTTFTNNGTNVVVINNSFHTVGIGSAATAQLEVWSTTNDVVKIHAAQNNQDNTIRVTTDVSNSTLGLAFEQTNTNRVGGIRMDQNGNISIHAGEDMFANLSNTSRVINILTNHNVGIGSALPQTNFDVAGNAKISGTLAVGTIPTITGSRTDGSALLNLLTALAAMGLIIDNSTP